MSACGAKKSAERDDWGDRLTTARRSIAEGLVEDETAPGSSWILADNGARRALQKGQMGQLGAQREDHEKTYSRDCAGLRDAE